MENSQETVSPLRVVTKTKLTPVFDMVEESCITYFRNFKKFIGVYLYGLIGFVPFAIVGLIYVLLTATTSLLDNIALRSILVVLMFFTGVWAIYYGIRIRAAMILLIKNNYTSAKESFDLSQKYFWAYVWVSILSTLVIGLWTLLLIIPGIIFAIYYLLYNYTFFLEDVKGMKALRRSKELVKGYWWAVCGRVMFIGLLAGLFNLLLALPLASMPEKSASYNIYNGFINLIWALISPIIIIYTYDIFRDLLAIKGESKLEKK